jgi:hypothetical protein
MTQENTKDVADMTDEELEAAENAVSGAEVEEVPEQLPSETPEPEDSTAPEAQEAVVAEVEPTATGENVDPEPRIKGVASKDGSRVLPYAALQAERRAAKHNAARATQAEERAQALEQQLADLKAGKVQESTELTEDEVKEIEEDFPERGRKIRAAFEAAKEVKAAKVSTNAAPANHATDDDPVQEAIDEVPLLSEWQMGDAEKFQRATQIDGILQTSPKWRGKSLSERFTEAARMVADEYDIPSPTAQTPAKSSQSKTAIDPRSVIANATRSKPNTLSDFKGGATPETPSQNFERLSATAQVDRWAGMSDEEIDAALAKSGG